MHAPRSPLAGRYRYVGRLRSSPGAEPWVALDADTGRHVIVGRAPAHRVRRFEAVKGEKHLYLAGVLDVLREPAQDSLPEGVTLPEGAALVVAEFVSGRTLHGLLRAGPIHPYKAVAWLLRLVDAVGVLHSRGGVHGAISPRLIVVEPAGRAIAPVLAQLVCPALGPYCSPERRGGMGPSHADDVWALHAALYAALTATAPNAGGELKPLADFGINEPVLGDLLAHGLARAQGERAADLAYLGQALDAWERGRQPGPPPAAPRNDPGPGNVPDDLILSDDSELPPEETLEVPEEEAVRAEPKAARGAPLPAPHAKHAARAAPPPFPAARRPAAARPATSSLRWPLLAAIGLGAVVLGAAGFYFTLSRPRPRPAPTEPSALASGSAAPTGSGSPTLAPAERLAACVKSFFPADAFEGPEDFGFLCQDDDLRTESTALFTLCGARETADAAAGKSPKGRGGLVVRASKRDDLGWYELVATTIVRSTCCKGAALPVLPKTDGWCQQLQAEVRNIAEATRKSGDLGPYTRRFDDAVTCLYATGTSRPYPYEKAPNEAERKAFQLFLKNAAETDGVRARMPWLR